MRTTWIVGLILAVALGPQAYAESPWAHGYAQDAERQHESKKEKRQQFRSQANDHPASRRSNAGQDDAAGMTMDEAVRQVQQQYGGRVLSAQPQSNGYQIRVLDRKGVVRTVFVSAGSRGQR